MESTLAQLWARRSDTFTIDKKEHLYELIQNQTCPKCKSQLTLEEDEENYLQFLD